MSIITLSLYLIACALCGLIGRNTSFGFTGHFILSLFITPIGDFLIQLVARPSREVRQRLQDPDED
jgi:hypothetical protein